MSADRLILRLPDSLNAVGVARRAVDVIGHSIPQKLREDTHLVVTELVTNGLRHGDGGVTISLAVSDDALLSGEVVDEGDGFDVPPAPQQPGPGGWGLPIVAALAERWGVEQGTTRVWFSMPEHRA